MSQGMGCGNCKFNARGLAFYPCHKDNPVGSKTVWCLEWKAKESKMEKTVAIKNIHIGLPVLVDKGACDEGILWFTKKYCHEGSAIPTLKEIYESVPKSDWKDWLIKKFPKYITEIKETYCCELLERAVKSREISDTNQYGNKQISTRTFGFSYCPFCGKKL